MICTIRGGHGFYNTHQHSSRALNIARGGPKIMLIPSPTWGVPVVDEPPIHLRNMEAIVGPHAQSGMFCAAERFRGTLLNGRDNLGGDSGWRWQRRGKTVWVAGDFGVFVFTLGGGRGRNSQDGTRSGPHCGNRPDNFWQGRAWLPCLWQLMNKLSDRRLIVWRKVLNRLQSRLRAITATWLCYCYVSRRCVMWSVGWGDL